MDDKLFDELLRSVEQMDGIAHGHHPPSRTFSLESSADETAPGLPQA